MDQRCIYICLVCCELRMKIVSGDLYIDHVEKEDIGSYHCVVERRDGAYDTSDVNLGK